MVRGVSGTCVLLVEPGEVDHFYERFDEVADVVGRYHVLDVRGQEPCLLVGGGDV